MARIWLDVPYAEKNEAKALGARWDASARRWYAPVVGLPGLERWAVRPDVPTLLPGEDRAEIAENRILTPLGGSAGTGSSALEPTDEHLTDTVKGHPEVLCLFRA
jgi:hypothetical protein